jgi:hypothetical protein
MPYSTSWAPQFWSSQGLPAVVQARTSVRGNACSATISWPAFTWYARSIALGTRARPMIPMAPSATTSHSRGTVSHRPASRPAGDVSLAWGRVVVSCIAQVR